MGDDDAILTGMIKAGSSTALGFTAVQLVQNVTVPHGTCWLDHNRIFIIHIQYGLTNFTFMDGGHLRQVFLTNIKIQITNSFHRSTVNKFFNVLKWCIFAIRN